MIVEQMLELMLLKQIVSEKSTMNLNVDDIDQFSALKNMKQRIQELENTFIDQYDEDRN